MGEFLIEKILTKLKVWEAENIKQITEGWSLYNA